MKKILFDFIADSDKGLIPRHLGRKQIFRLILRLLAAGSSLDNCGNTTTAKSISNYFNSQKVRVSVDTIQNYIHHLESAFLFYRIPRFDIKGKKFLEYFDKLYMGDIGLRNGFIGYIDKDISGILENIVLLEMKKRGYKISIGALNGNEVDFIAEKQNERLYIQVTRNLEEEKTIKREFGNLERISNNYRKIVLSMDKFFNLITTVLNINIYRTICLRIELSSQIMLRQKLSNHFCHLVKLY